MLVSKGSLGFRKWILVVEDDVEFAELVKTYLNLHFENELKIVTAVDGADATRKVNFQAFDCIITDLAMPNKEGHAFISYVRRSNLNAECPVIIISGLPRDPQADHEHSFTYRLDKPFNQNEIIPLVESQIKLGKANNRIAADLVNNILQSI